MELDARGLISRSCFLRKTCGDPGFELDNHGLITRKEFLSKTGLLDQEIEEQVNSPVSVAMATQSGFEALDSWQLEPSSAGVTATPTAGKNSVDKTTRFTAVAESFQDDVNSKLGDWVCGYASMFGALGFVPKASGSGSPGCTVDLPSTRHLDIGCGKGALCNVLSKAVGVGAVVGVDVCQPVVAEARLRYCAQENGDSSSGDGRSSSRHETPGASPCSIAFRVVKRSGGFGEIDGGLFDSASACYVLSGLRSREQQLDFLRNAGRMLKPGGKLAVLVNNPDTCGTRFTSIQLRGERFECRGFETGQRVRAHFFWRSGEEYFQCNDRWWPRSHYVDLFESAGFSHVSTFTESFGPGLEPACAVMGLSSEAVPLQAPERTAAPVLCLTGTWKGTETVL
mmetsp:Transcript_29772/g.50172  ORF Transcript_29772/g.50172 Transcript_29772/m.50172 type:complete len:397 (+) Transcript_29772:139-1329(+)